MKPIYTLILAALVVASCKKEVQERNGTFSLQSIQHELKDSMLGEDFSRLDFSHALYNHVDSAGLYFLRVPFKGTSIAENFVLVKLNVDGNIKEGRIIRLNGGVLGVAGDPVRIGEWEGNISISPLNRESVVNSAVHRGYIEAFHPGLNTRETLLGASVLPEVVVVAYVDRIEPMDYSTWLWLNSFFYINNFTDSGGGGGGESGSGGSYYGSLGGYSGGGGTTGDTGNLGPAVSSDETMLIDLDTYVDHEAIDVEQYLKCFDNIPDAGATCSVEILTDIPVDSDPSKLFNWQTDSPGHVFLQLKKSNGTQFAQQSIGFYPNTNWKNILNADPVDSKMVDDGGHEFNASLKMNVSPFNLRSVIGKIKELSKMKYDMDEFNCTDFALEVFNYVRTPLEIPKYVLPGGTVVTNTPQGLYNKLLEMKQNNDPEAANTTVGFLKGYVGGSSGPCN